MSEETNGARQGSGPEEATAAEPVRGETDVDAFARELRDEGEPVENTVVADPADVLEPLGEDVASSPAERGHTSE